MPAILTPQEEIDASLDQLKEQFTLVDDPRESDPTELSFSQA